MESDPLVGEDPLPLPTPGKRLQSESLKRKAAVAGALAGLALGVLGATAVARGSIKTSPSGTPLASMIEYAERSKKYVTLRPVSENLHGLVVSNKYIVDDGPESRPILYPWIGEGETVLEPFHETTFSVLKSDEASTAPSGTYEWKITRDAAGQGNYELDLKASRRRLLESRGLSLDEINEREPEYDDGIVVRQTIDNKDATSVESNSFVHTFNELGKHMVTVTDTVSGLSTSATVHIKYVRKEMRSVDEDDREALFKAWKVLIEMNDTDGVAKYGNNFMSHGRLSTEHNNLAGDRICDHLHDGMGFVPGHLSLTRLLEASLQSVDSTIALPYWEYTIDVEDIIANHNGDFFEWRNIPAFTDDWFGHTNIKTGHVHSGTFSDMTLVGNEFTTVSNSWGIIRAPWNNLKDPGFVRYFGGGSALREQPNILVDADQMSTCEVVYETIGASTKLDTFNGAAAGQAHGPIHMFTGGQSNTPEFANHLTKIGLKASGKIHNQFWGSGVTFFFASIKSLYRAHLYNCPESCSSETSETDCACTCSAADIMNSTYKEDLFSGWMTSWSNQGLDADETLRKMLDLLCNEYHNVVMGDHASSGSTSDPSFWLIHGTVERWLQLIRIYDYFEREDWDTPVFTSNFHPMSTTCSGHQEGSKLVFGAVDGNDFTNKEYYDYISPKFSYLPYVYDNFNWDHCKELGYDIYALVADSKSSSDSSD